MSDMNVCTLTGRLTKDAETRTMQSGAVLVTFAIANNTGFGQYACTNFFEVNAWGKQVAAILQYLTKGKQVGISGTLENKAWTDNNGVKHDKWVLTAQGAITLLGGGSKPDVEESYKTASAEDAVF